MPVPDNPELVALWTLYENDGDLRAPRMVIRAIEDTEGHVEQVCRDLRVSVPTFYRYLKRYPDLQRILRKARYLRREARKGMKRKAGAA